MTRMLGLLLLVSMTLGLTIAQDAPPDATAAPRFVTVPIVIDPAGQPLAAYQLTFTTNAVIVGIEGGEHPAFADPPYYDPKAIQHNRAILAAFNTAAAAELPHGPTRVATVHLRLPDGAEPAHHVADLIAADPDGRPVPAAAELHPEDVNHD